MQKFVVKRTPSTRISSNGEISIKHSGYLKKKRIKVGGWNKLWFVLQNQLLLSYSSREECEEKLGPFKDVISLVPGTQVMPMQEQKFTIETTSKTMYTFRCEDDKSCSEWIAALLESICSSDRPVLITNETHVPRPIFCDTNASGWMVTKRVEANHTFDSLTYSINQSSVANLTAINKIAKLPIASVTAKILERRSFHEEEDEDGLIQARHYESCEITVQNFRLHNEKTNSESTSADVARINQMFELSTVAPKFESKSFIKNSDENHLLEINQTNGYKQTKTNNQIEPRSEAQDILKCLNEWKQNLIVRGEINQQNFAAGQKSDLNLELMHSNEHEKPIKMHQQHSEKTLSQTNTPIPSDRINKTNQRNKKLIKNVRKMLSRKVTDLNQNLSHDSDKGIKTKQPKLIKSKNISSLKKPHNDVEEQVRKLSLDDEDDECLVSESNETNSNISPLEKKKHNIYENTLDEDVDEPSNSLKLIGSENLEAVYAVVNLDEKHSRRISANRPRRSESLRLDFHHRQDDENAVDGLVLSPSVNGPSKSCDYEEVGIFLPSESSDDEVKKRDSKIYETLDATPNEKKFWHNLKRINMDRVKLVARRFKEQTHLKSNIAESDGEVESNRESQFKLGSFKEFKRKIVAHRHSLKKHVQKIYLHHLSNSSKAIDDSGKIDERDTGDGRSDSESISLELMEKEGTSKHGTQILRKPKTGTGTMWYEEEFLPTNHVDVDGKKV